jgi:hypothetical protein
VRHALRRAIFFGAFCLLIIAFGLPRFTGESLAASRALSDAQLNKIKGFLAEHGGPDSVSKIVTDILGLTQGNETITSRALAVHGDNPSDIHQIDILPNRVGYLETHFHDGRAEIFWADPNFNLQFAVEGARDARPAAISFPEAEAGLAAELAWWANFADTH